MAIADGVQRIGAPIRRWARVQKREYTNGEERPLGGDLGAMGVYLGLVSAASAAVRASGRELPERIPFGDALLLTVGTFRLARRLAKDPVTAPIREHISSETYSAMVIGISDHNTVLPNLAPDCA